MFHGIFGSYGTRNGGKEKASAAICMKVSAASSEIVMWVDGMYSFFLYISDAIEAIIGLMCSSFNSLLIWGLNGLFLLIIF